MTTYKFDLIAIAFIPLALWLGFSGRVDWWVIALVTLSHINLNLTVRR